MLHNSTVQLEPLQLDHGVLQHGELISRLRPLLCGFQALSRDALHHLIREIADNLWGENGGKFLKQTVLDGQGADVINEGFQSNLFSTC